jgi:hypothetical protein
MNENVGAHASGAEASKLYLAVVIPSRPFGFFGPSRRACAKNRRADAHLLATYSLALADEAY